MKPFRVLAALFLLLASVAASAAQMPRFDALEQRLKIRPEQKEQYEMAVGATKRALLAVAINAMEVKQRLADELGKDRPDFSRLIDSYALIVDQNRPLFKEAGREWGKLYAILDDDQVEIARQFLKDNLGRYLPIPEPR